MIKLNGLNKTLKTSLLAGVLLGATAPLIKLLRIKNVKNPTQNPTRYFNQSFH